MDERTQVEQNPETKPSCAAYQRWYRQHHPEKVKEWRQREFAKRREKRAAARAAKAGEKA